MSGLYPVYQKANIGNEKVNIEDQKVNIAVSDVYGSAIKDMPKKTVEYIQKVYSEFGTENVFGRTDMPLAEYLRKRRMSLAAVEMMEENALRVGEL